MSTFIGAVTRLSRRRQAPFTNATNAFDTQFASHVVAAAKASHLTLDKDENSSNTIDDTS
jgi:hypothetical protein